MITGIPSLDELNPTPDEKRFSRIAADIWGVRPVRCNDGDAHPLLREVWVDGDDKLIRGELGRLGVAAFVCALPEVSSEEGGWTPIHLADGVPVLRGGTYRYMDAFGLIYENCGIKFTDLTTALFMTLDFERNGTPKERPHNLGAGPAIDLESWRSTFTHYIGV